jgi:hypothetical protein
VEIPKEDKNMDIPDFGMALGLADEMTQEERDALRQKKLEAEEEMEELAIQLREIEDEGESTAPGTFSLRSRYKTKDKPLDEFAEYLDAVMRGEVDVDWAVFNRQG